VTVAAAALSEHVLQWVMEAQFVELDIFFEALERGVAGKLLEPGDVHPLGDAARDRATPEAVSGKGGAARTNETRIFVA
jgi:hypothetical protein